MTGDHPHDDAQLVAATVAFAEERRRYHQDMAAEAERDRTMLAYVAMEDAADGAMRRREGAVWERAIARALGTRTEARLWEVLLYSPIRAHRERAANILVQELRVGRATEAA